MKKKAAIKLPFCYLSFRLVLGRFEFEFVFIFIRFEFEFILDMLVLLTIVGDGDGDGDGDIVGNVLMFVVFAFRRFAFTFPVVSAQLEAAIETAIPIEASKSDSLLIVSPKYKLAVTKPFYNLL